MLRTNGEHLPANHGGFRPQAFTKSAQQSPGVPREKARSALTLIAAAFTIGVVTGTLIAGYLIAIGGIVL